MNKDEIIQFIKAKVSEIVFKNFNIDLKKDEIEVSIPGNIENGDLSTNVALKLTKIVKKNPLEIANIISKNLQNDLEYINSIEVKKPGFINFYLANSYYDNLIKEINNTNDFIFDTGEHNYYNVEFVSANPTGDLHLGHARNAIYGDTIVRLLKKIGNKVDSEYYINDAGMQMHNLALSVKYFYDKLLGIDGDFPQDGYCGEEIQAIASKIFNIYGSKKENENLEWFKNYAYHENLEEIKRILHELKINFDIWTSEKSLHDKNLVEEKIDLLAKKGDIYSKDDALWLATSKYFDDKDRVLKKSDGLYTYFASDVAYHMDKFDRNYTNLIDVWGGDHHGYINRVRSVIASLGKNPSDFEVLTIQMINILQNNERVKMSKRKGTSVTIKELLSEIDVDSLRYFFLMRSPDSQMDFDIELAKQESSNNPIFYIQYANARINTLLLRANEEKINTCNDVLEYNYSICEKKLLNLLSDYKKVIINAANLRLPHLLCNYLLELASAYHHYYNLEPVFNNDEKIVSAKLNIAKVIKKIIVDGLMTLGIDPKDKM